MTYEQQRMTIDHKSSEPTRVGEQPPGEEIAEQHVRTTYRPSGSTVASRVVVTLFGIVEALLLVRIVLLLLAAQRDNGLVAAILDASGVFVAPFEGMFATDAVVSGSSVLDVAAITALIAVVIVELILLAIVRIPRRSEAV